MNKFITMMLTLAVMLFAANSFAWDPPASPAPASWISDTSGVLSPAAHGRLDTKLKQINQSSANELAALILPGLDGQNIEDVTNATFKAWGVGKKNLDNGVLVVLAMKEHKMRIETGKGVEGDLPDLKTQDIQVNVMRPRMRANDVEGALSAGFDAIATSIANHKADVAAGHSNTPSPAPTTSTTPNSASCDVAAPGSSGSGNGFLIVGGGLIALAVFWLLASNARSRREEKRLSDLRLETERLRREQAERRSVAEAARAQRALELASPPLPVPQPRLVQPDPFTPMPPRVVSQTRPATHHPVIGTAVAAAAVTTTAELDRQRTEETARHRRAEEDRKRREREEENERRRRRDEESSSSSSSSSSSDSGSSWSGGSSSSDSSSSWDSGGGSSDSGSGSWGGGDSGGGGSSSDW